MGREDSTAQALIEGSGVGEVGSHATDRCLMGLDVNVEVERFGHSGPSRRIRSMPRPRVEPERTEVSVPAEARQVRILRLVTAGTMSLHGFGANAVEDVRSAVSEACALVLGNRGAVGRLNLLVVCGERGVQVTIRGDFDIAPEHGREDDLRAQQLFMPFVDHCEIDLDHHRVSFEVNL